MSVPLACLECRSGRYTPDGRRAGLYVCGTCRHSLPEAEARAVMEADERLVLRRGILHILSVPDGHHVITPTRRAQGAHLAACLALALRFPVFPDADRVRSARRLLTALDSDESGPWVLSPAELATLISAMDFRNTVIPSTARQHVDFDAQVRAAYSAPEMPPPSANTPAPQDTKETSR
ncbi:hypothetical protein ACFRIB_38200 [Streptomyces mirabilis]|uniref:hypothetical protein n=1 Tax=Streptomyces mirabilis TaxID=68239 RepID=UPI0036C33150